MSRLIKNGSLRELIKGDPKRFKSNEIRTMLQPVNKIRFTLLSMYVGHFIEALSSKLESPMYVCRYLRNRDDIAGLALMKKRKNGSARTPVCPVITM